MPEGRYSTVVVLCEDSTHLRFIKAWLAKHCHVDPHGIRSRLSPSGRGAAERFVCDEFPKEATAHRAKAKSRGTLLIAAVDADTLATAERRRQLACVPAVLPNERIFVFIPKRNIETWIRSLNGRKANEEDSYRHSKDNGEIAGAAAAFLALVRGGPEPELPSLAQGILEARRIPREHEPR